MYLVCSITYIVFIQDHALKLLGNKLLHSYIWNYFCFTMFGAYKRNNLRDIYRIIVSMDG